MVDESEGVGSGSAGDGDRYRHLVAHIHDAVVEFELVDGEPMIRGVNEAFVDTFGYEESELVGESLNDRIVPAWLTAEAHRLDEQTGDGEINYCRVRRETTNGLREFLYRGIPYEDTTVSTDGFAIYTDLTDIVRNERRIQVMNRILRHNLRNKANIVVANTSRILAELDEQTGERTRVAASIEEAGHELERLAGETSDIQRILASPEVDDSGIDCVPVVRTAVAEYDRNAPTTTFETELPGSMHVYANSHLRAALSSLLDNAVTHNPASEPTVRARVVEADADGWVDIHVEDDGPRIPARERDVITGAVEITPVQHGSGLGLWLVKWTTELFGGELSFGASDLGGNDVRLRLPRR